MAERGLSAGSLREPPRRISCAGAALGEGAARGLGCGGARRAGARDAPWKRARSARALSPHSATPAAPTVRRIVPLGWQLPHAAKVAATPAHSPTRCVPPSQQPSVPARTLRGAIARLRVVTGATPRIPQALLLAKRTPSDVGPGACGGSGWDRGRLVAGSRVGRAGRAARSWCVSLPGGLRGAIPLRAGCPR